jgi:hypothetical protein
MERKMKRQMKSLALALLLVTVGAWSAIAAEQVQFMRKQAAGDKFTFSQTTVMDTDMTMSANGQVVQQAKQKVTQTRVGSTSVEAADAAGKPTKMTFVFDKSCGGEMAVSGQPSQPVPTSLAGKTITVTRTGEKALNYSAEVDQAGAAEVKEMFAQDHTLLPEKPIAVGDTWEIDPSEVRAIFALGAQLDATAKGKLVSVENTGGRQVANVEFTIAMSGNMQGMTMKSELKGKGTVEVANSQPLEMEITGPMTAGARQQSPNGPVDMAMDGKMTMNLKWTRQGAGDIAAVGAPAHPIEQIGNPLGLRPTGPDFPGTYSNEKMTVTLENSEKGLVGRIKTGDKDYPIATIAIDGTKLTGDFAVGTDFFHYDAALDGKTLTFKTGGATYTLTRAAPSNPLGR